MAWQNLTDQEKRMVRTEAYTVIIVLCALAVIAGAWYCFARTA